MSKEEDQDYLAIQIANKLAKKSSPSPSATNTRKSCLELINKIEKSYSRAKLLSPVERGGPDFQVKYNNQYLPLRDSIRASKIDTDSNYEKLNQFYKDVESACQIHQTDLTLGLPS